MSIIFKIISCKRFCQQYNVFPFSPGNLSPKLTAKLARKKNQINIYSTGSQVHTVFAASFSSVMQVCWPPST